MRLAYTRADPASDPRSYITPKLNSAEGMVIFVKMKNKTDTRVKGKKGVDFSGLLEISFS